jgi:hypothetical protein
VVLPVALPQRCFEALQEGFGSGCGLCLYGSVFFDQLAAERRQLGAAAVRSTRLGCHYRLMEAGVHIIDEQPSAPV